MCAIKTSWPTDSKILDLLTQLPQGSCAVAYYNQIVRLLDRRFHRTPLVARKVMLSKQKENLYVQGQSLYNLSQRILHVCIVTLCVT